MVFASFEVKNHVWLLRIERMKRGKRKGKSIIRVGTGRGWNFDYGFITGMGNTCAAPTWVWDGYGE